MAAARAHHTYLLTRYSTACPCAQFSEANSKVRFLTAFSYDHFFASSLPDSSRNGFTLRLARRASTAAAGDGTSSSPLLFVFMAAAKRSPL
jgi:hypothetical protein